MTKLENILTDRLNTAITKDLDSKKIIRTCPQCSKDMGNEWLLSAVCGACCRKNHRRVCGN